MFNQIEGQACDAEQAIEPPPSPPVRKRREDQSSGKGHFSPAEQATAIVPEPLDTVIATIVALQRQRRFMIKSQSRINRSLEAYLAQLAGYRPKTAPDGSKLTDASGKRVEDKDGKKLWAEIGRVRRMVEAGKLSEAQAPERAGQIGNAEQAISWSPARKSSRKGSREGQCVDAEQASQLTPSLPHWANVSMILASAQSRAVWDAMRNQVERDMIRLAKQLPVYPWWQAIKGAGDLGLAIIVGEVGDVGSYRDKSALWKRLGLAVIDGGRQRKVAGDAAIAHGYSPVRRAEIWTIADSLFKHQWRGADEDIGRIAGPSGPYGEHYGRRKSYLTERERGVNESEPWSAKHIDNDARRYMTKALIRDLRAAWLEYSARA